MNFNPDVRALEAILRLTAFAAGTVDVISFAKLGGILASAMTGNLAFMGYYLSRGAFASATGSAIALGGFVAGGAVATLVSQQREQAPALRVLLRVETLLLAAAVLLWLPTQHRNGSASGDGVILLLATAMGVQSIVGKKVNLSNIPTVVFTSTLTNIVIALTGMLARQKLEISGDTRRQLVSFSLYFLGALCAGWAVFFATDVEIFLPLAAALAWLSATKKAVPF